MADYTIKQHDTWPPLLADLSDVNGPIDLTDADSVRLILRSDRVLVRTGEVEVVTPTFNGQVRYTWQDGDTDVVGEYRLEFEIRWISGGIETVPNDGYKTLSIVQDLG